MLSALLGLFVFSPTLLCPQTALVGLLPGSPDPVPMPEGERESEREREIGERQAPEQKGDRERQWARRGPGRGLHFPLAVWEKKEREREMPGRVFK